MNRAFAISIVPIVALPLVGAGQSFTLPERLGVVDVIPNDQSGETTQNSEPSLGVGTGANFGKLVLAVDGPSGHHLLFTSTDSGSHWVQRDAFAVGDATVDWSAGGMAYEAVVPITLPHLWNIELLNSSDPSAGISFSTADYLNTPADTDQPNVTVVNVNGVDQIYVGFAAAMFYPNLAAVRFSVNGGVAWNTTGLEKATPGIMDSFPGTRLAASGDGQRIYAVFERFQANLPDTTDEVGDVVLVRDDNRGLGGFSALPVNGNGGSDGAPDTQVARNIVLPSTGIPGYGTSLGSERLGGETAIALHPGNADLVYVGYTEVVSGTPIIRLMRSGDGGKNFQLVYSAQVASAKPTLAVAEDGTVGLLFAELAGNNMEIHFVKAARGDFSQIQERVLASFPDNDPVKDFNPYIGDFFQLRAVGDNFYGTFCASGEPQPSHFPCGVVYQRNVLVNGIVRNNFALTSVGTLVDLAQNPVAPSIDPFFFYDIASQFIRLPVLEFVPQWFIDPSDPLAGTRHFRWPVLPPSYPQFGLESSPQVGASATWTAVTDVPVLQTNGMFLAPIQAASGQRFFRLSQNAAAGQFNLFASVDNYGSLSPNGIVLKSGLQSQTFAARAASNYAIDKWFLDGVAVQSNSPALTLSNIDAEHIVLVTFAASNDVAVTVGTPAAYAVVNSNLIYSVRVQNTGIEPVTNVTLTNPLPALVSFVSATSSQGSVGQTTPGIVSGNLGALGPGALALVQIAVTPLSGGAITDLVSVACAQFEPNLANNSAMDVKRVVEPVAITNQPVSQTVSAGATVSFTVGGSGSPPILYRWYFNGAEMASATNATLTLTNVTAMQSGSYSAALFQVLGFDQDDIFEADSAAASLQVGP